MNADEAYELGIVDFIVEDEQQVEQKIAEWQAKPLQAMIATKTLYAKLTKDELLKVLQLETEAQQKNAANGRPPRRRPRLFRKTEAEF